MKIFSIHSLNGKSGKPVFQYLAMITGNLSLISSGMIYGWPTITLPKLLQTDSVLHITKDQGSWLAVMPFIGAILGAMIGAACVDIIGRKKVILLSCLPSFMSWMMIAYGQSVTIIVIARFISGLTDGFGFTAIPMYLCEIADPNIRGLLASSSAATWILGILFVNVIGSFNTITTTALISASVPILLFVTFIWMPESPYFLVMKNREPQAQKSLQILMNKNNVEPELTRISNSVKEEMKSKGKFLDLLTIRSNRRALCIMMGIRGGQQFSGTTAITFYASSIFEQAGSKLPPEIATIIYFSVQGALCVLSTLVVDKTGRRPLLIISIIGSTVALFTSGLYFYFIHLGLTTDKYSFLLVISLITYIVMFSLGMQTIPLLIIGEIFPTNVKAFALCFADIYMSVTGTIVSKIFQFTKDEFGVHVPFFIFTVFAILTLFFIMYCIPETKGKTLEEIQQCLKEDNSKSEPVLKEYKPTL